MNTYIENIEEVTLIKDSAKNKYGQYFTPEIVANFMISISKVNADASILEPSCGEGIFLNLLEQKGFNNVIGYEIDESLAQNFQNVKYESFISAEIDKKFDLIIGNPPYIRWKNLENELKEELQKNEIWNLYFNSLCDYLYIFILKSIQLLKENGELIFICPEYWMSTTHSISLRNFISKNGYFEEIYHFNETPIFNNASVSVIIFKFIKSKKKTEKKIKITKYFKNRVLTKEKLEEIKINRDDNNEIETFYINQFEENKRWLLTNQSEIESIKKFEKSCGIHFQTKNLFESEVNYSTIGDICDIGNGMVSGLDKAFQLNGLILTEKENENLIKVVKAKDLEPFYYNEITKYIFVKERIDEQTFKKDFPNFYSKLIKNEEQLNNRYLYNRKINFWEWVFLRNFKLFNSDQPRIFVPSKDRISNKDYFRFSYVESGVFPTQDVSAIFLKEKTEESIFYILAFLNNYRIFNWLKNKGIIKGSIVEFSEKPISSIPFRKINFNITEEKEIHDQISYFTEFYLETKEDLLLDKINDLLDKILEKV